MTCRYPLDRKAHVRRVRNPWDPDRWCWQAGRPGYVYLYGEGWHFNRWDDAMAHATSTHEPPRLGEDYL